MTITNNYRVALETIELQSTENANTFTAITNTVKPSDVEREVYLSAVWTAIKKTVKNLHTSLYKDVTPDIAVANAVYHVTFDESSKTIVIPLVELLQGDSKHMYNNKAAMLQTATVQFVNSTFSTPQLRSKARAKTEKSYKTILQWAFDFLTAGRTDGIKINANDRDVDIISGLLLKLKSEKITTTGEKTIQAYIEFAFRQKVAGKEFFVNLYSTIKDNNDVKVTTVQSAAEVDKSSNKTDEITKINEVAESADVATIETKATANTSTIETDDITKVDTAAESTDIVNK